MDRFVENMLKEFEGGKMSRRQLIQTIAAAATIYGAGEEAFAAPAPATLGFNTICCNHISYSVTGTDYGKARDFYIKVFGLDYPEDKDGGNQAYLPFGPKEAGTFMLPRGGNDPNAAPAAPRGAGGGGRGGARGGAAGSTAGGADAAPARGPVTVTVDQVGYQVANLDVKKAGEALKKFGLDPKPDGDSLHITDPFGMELQICGNKISAY
jgi:hypothetical protein